MPPAKDGRHYVSRAELRRMAINEDHAGHDDREQAFERERKWGQHAIQIAATDLEIEACGMPAWTRRA
jgi:hypothetical protein